MITILCHELPIPCLFTILMLTSNVIIVLSTTSLIIPIVHDLCAWHCSIIIVINVLCVVSFIISRCVSLHCLSPTKLIQYSTTIESCTGIVFVVVEMYQ